MDSIIQTITVLALPVLFAITLHEAAHGYVARHLGDPTAYLAGRISLNPLRHIDPIGTIAVPLFLLFTAKLMGGAGFIFGWAKPVPVNWSRLKRPKQDILWVALAGPAANFAMALFWALLLKLLFIWGAAGTDFWAQMAVAGIQINIILMVFNLLPLPPLDGGRIVYSLLPMKWAQPYARIEPYGMLILLLLLFSGVLWQVLQPIIWFFYGFFSWFL
ncbi:MAG TPA: site-2 protease family protein [Paenalcaligenes sp.]|nr:site-2 protease family protein [Paenalcaligenes sp.]